MFVIMPISTKYTHWALAMASSCWEPIRPEYEDKNVMELKYWSTVYSEKQQRFIVHCQQPVE